MYIRKGLHSKKGFSIKWYSILVLIIIILLLLLALSLNRYFEDKELRDKQSANYATIVTIDTNHITPQAE